nr:unnamed protein product [Digitaria exilis]
MLALCDGDKTDGSSILAGAHPLASKLVAVFVLLCCPHLNQRTAASTYFIYLEDYYRTKTNYGLAFHFVLGIDLAKALPLPSMEVTNRYVAIRHRIEGAPTEADFEVKEQTTRWSPDSGEVLVKNLYLSIDPYQHNRMKRGAVLAGQRIVSYAVGEVVASASPEYAAGDMVAGVLGWEDYTLFKPSPTAHMSKVDASAGFPLSYHIGVLGTSGMTAYGGLFEVCKPVKGEKVFVSAAAGSIGSLVGQFAKLAGCYVVGCAGTKAKVDLLKDKLGFDDAFNYKEEPDLKSALKRSSDTTFWLAGRYFPNGIDIYFDNVGGEMLEAALANMNIYGRVAVCGVISEYTGAGRPAVPDMLGVIYKRITIRGIYAWDFMPKRFAEFYGVISDWIRQGKVQVIEDVSDGLENVPAAFVELFTGQNVGKKLVKLACSTPSSPKPRQSLIGAPPELITAKQHHPDVTFFPTNGARGFTKLIFHPLLPSFKPKSKNELKSFPSIALHQPEHPSASALSCSALLLSEPTHGRLVSSIALPTSSSSTIFLAPVLPSVTNRYVATRHHIEGAPTVADFEVKQETTRWSPDSGEVLVKNLYLSIDPYQLNRMKRSSASHLAVDGILPGQHHDLMRCSSPLRPPYVVSLKRIASYAIGEVVASASPEYVAGDVVAGVLGWEDYTLFTPSPAVLMGKLDASSDFPLSHHISVLGTSGMTAYGGLFEVCKAVKGEKVFVSAASGSVGLLAGQFAKLAGCYVVGCAGTKAKVDLLKEKLGFDDAFNYKEEPDLKSALKRYFPNGIDINFENVGGEMMEAVLANMNTYGRVALCGVISEYTGASRRAVPDLLEMIYKRITIRGFFAWDFLPKFAEYNAGKVQVIEDVSDGLENLPAAFVELFTGQNVGKKIVKLATKQVSLAEPAADGATKPSWWKARHTTNSTKGFKHWTEQQPWDYARRRCLLCSPSCFPFPLPPPPPPKMMSQRLELPESLVGPESVAFDGHGGGPYASVADGRVLRWDVANASWTTYAYSPSYTENVCASPATSELPPVVRESLCGRPLGLRFHLDSGDLYIADAYMGLMRVGPGGGEATVVATETGGAPLRFTNGVDVDQVSGEVYFTDSSQSYQRWQHRMVTATGDSTGRVMRYDPRTNHVTVLLSNVMYPNGVAISADRTHLVVALTGPCKLLRYWLRGPMAGESEVFIDLPGVISGIGDARTPVAKARSYCACAFRAQEDQGGRGHERYTTSKKSVP